METLSRDEGLHSLDSDPRQIDELVQCWNERARITRASDAENYINGHIKFLFEYLGNGNAEKSKRRSNVGTEGPIYIPAILAEVHCSIEAGGKVGHLPPDRFNRKPCVVGYWNKPTVLVDDLLAVEQIEEFVPSRFTMRLEAQDEVEELWGNPVGQSVLYGFIKPCRCFGEGELNLPEFSGAGGKWSDDLRVGVVQSAAQVVQGVTADQLRVVYDGFVLFGERGSLAGLCVCFEDVREGALFAQQFAKFSDVFRGPMNL